MLTKSQGKNPLAKMGACFAIALIVMGCNPTVRVEAPEPIRIQIDATIRIVIEKDVEEVLADEDLF